MARPCGHLGASCRLHWPSPCPPPRLMDRGGFFSRPPSPLGVSRGRDVGDASRHVAMVRYACLRMFKYVCDAQDGWVGLPPVYMSEVSPSSDLCGLNAARCVSASGRRWQVQPRRRILVALGPGASHLARWVVPLASVGTLAAVFKLGADSSRRERESQRRLHATLVFSQLWAPPRVAQTAHDRNR